MDKLIIIFLIADQNARNAFEVQLNSINGACIFDYVNEKMAVIDEKNHEAIVETLQKFVDMNQYARSDYAKWVYPHPKPQCANHVISGRFF